MANDRPTPDDISELTDAVEACDVAWSVDDWNYQSGKYETPEVQLTITWEPPTDEFDADVIDTGTATQQRERVKSIKGLVARIEADYDEGAPVSDVIRAAVHDLDMRPQLADGEIERLRTRGEVYEPKQGHLRTT